MFNYIKNFFKHSAIYGTSSILTKVSAVVLVPLYVKFLTPDDYGSLEILTTTASFLLITLQMGMGAAIFRSIIYKQNTDQQELISTAFYFLMISSLISCAILIIFSKQLSAVLFDRGFPKSLLELIFLTTFLNTFSTIPLAFLRINNQSIKFSIISIINFFVDVALNILFVAVLKKGMAGIIIAGLIKSMIFTFVFVYLIRDSLQLRFSFAELKDMLGFGLPLVPAGLCLMVLTISNRYFLKYFCTLNDVGLFALGYRIGMIMGLIINAFQIAWPSIMFSIAREDHAQQTFKRIFTYYLMAILFIGLVISIFSKETITILRAEAYLNAYRIIPLIVISYIFMGIYYLTSVGINLKKKTKYDPVIVGTAAILNIILNYLLIPRYAIMGAAISSAISFFVMAVLEWKISIHFYPIQYEYLKIAKLIGVIGVLFYLSQIIPQNNLIYHIGLKFLLLMTFPVLLIVIRFFESHEIKRLKHEFHLAISNRMKGVIFTNRVE